MYEDSYLKKAAQLWKLYLGMAAVLIGGVLVWVGRSRIGSSGDRAVVTILVGTAVGLAGMVWSAVAIKCPACGTRLLWEAVSTQSAGSWLTWLLHLDACPSCGRREAPGPPNSQFLDSSGQR